MRILVDNHTHTIASTHAYSTVIEMAHAAADRGIELLAITDHAPALQDAPDELHFMGCHVLPSQLFGVGMLYGAELNILDASGALDLSDEIRSRLDICIASYHPACTPPGSKEENTRAYLGAMECPQVQVIGHPNDGFVPVDFDELARAAAANDVMLELNNSTLRPVAYRKGTRENAIAMLAACERHGCHVSVGTDAHFAGAVGDFTLAGEMLDEVGFPEELVANVSAARFCERLALRSGRKPCHGRVRGDCQ